MRGLFTFAGDNKIMPPLTSRLSRLAVLALLLMSTALIAPPAQPALAAWTLDCDTATSIAIPAAECKALQSLYENLDGDNWSTNTGWGTDTAASTWYGLTVTGGSVQQIALYYNNLSGDIDGWDPSGLSALQKLYMHQNAIGGSIDGWDVSGLSALQALALSGNAIGGDIDGFDISGLSTLDTVSLNDNQIGGSIDGFDVSGLSVLRVLSLHTNAIGGSIDGLDISGLSALQFLLLHGNAITGDPAALVYPSSLRVLNLYGNRLDGTVPDLTGTAIGVGFLGLCPNTRVRPSGDAAVDAYAESRDATGWTAAEECGNVPESDGNDDGENNRVHPTEEEATPTPTPPTVFGAPSVTVTVDPAGASPGGQVTWTVVVANESQHPTDNVLYMRSELPAALALVTAESTRREVLVDGQSVQTPIGVLDPGDSVTVTLVTAVGEDADPGEVCLTASADWNYLVSGTGCVQVVPAELPPLGGRPVEGMWWPWVAALAGVAGLWVMRRRV
jgi:uncharacterized repeat protein (TIGR01451 family)